jgi:hypothetical protein
VRAAESADPSATVDASQTESPAPPSDSVEPAVIESTDPAPAANTPGNIETAAAADLAEPTITAPTDPAPVAAALDESDPPPADPALSESSDPAPLLPLPVPRERAGVRARVTAAESADPSATADAPPAESIPSAIVEPIEPAPIADSPSAATSRPAEQAKPLDPTINSPSSRPAQPTPATPPKSVPSNPAPTITAARPIEPSSASAEREALKLDLDIDSLPPPASKRKPVSTPSAVPANLNRWLVTALKTVNAPAQNMPEALRELLGKVALVTTFNAVAVLIYVLLFHRHH